MRTLLFVATAAAIGVIGSAFFLLEKGPTVGAQTTANVSIGDNWFCNTSFADGICDTNITAGDTVLWTNTGTFPHTVTECGDAFTPCPQSGGFDSGTLTNSQTFSRAFPTPGIYEYWCNIHGSVMRGRVAVAAAQQTPTPTPGAAAAPGIASPTPTRTAAAPAAVPGTGGSPTDGGVAAPPVLAIVGAALFIACAFGGAGVVRRR